MNETQTTDANEAPDLSSTELATVLHGVGDAPAVEADPRIVGMGQKQLADSFRSILETSAIYYPVAYRLDRQLGQGQQGVVFQAQRQGARGCFTQHAVKIFNPSVYPSVKKYWNDMGRIAAQISRLQSTRSPQLVDCDIYEETNGIWYIQMELVDGMNLRELLNNSHLAIAKTQCSAREWSQFMRVLFNFHEDTLCIQPGVAVYIMRQMLTGLETLHSARYLHCDIKPMNIMLDPLGYVKIIDFGRANFINERTTLLLGTPSYMAPEVHERKGTSIQSDLYSVGLVGLELLRGKPLVDQKNLSESEWVRLKQELPDRLPDLVPPYVRRNDQLVGILKRLLHPDPRERFPDARSAETTTDGLGLVHRQLSRLDIDSDYRRDLGTYINRLGYPKSR